MRSRGTRGALLTIPHHHPPPSATLPYGTCRAVKAITTLPPPLPYRTIFTTEHQKHTKPSENPKSHAIRYDQQQNIHACHIPFEKKTSERSEACSNRLLGSQSRSEVRRGHESRAGEGRRAYVLLSKRCTSESRAREKKKGKGSSRGRDEARLGSATATRLSQIQATRRKSVSGEKGSGAPLSRLIKQKKELQGP